MSRKNNLNIHLTMSPVEAVFCVILIIAIIGVWTYPLNGDSPYEGPYEVVKIVDGDTVKLSIDGDVTTVRLIGVDTPESVHPTKEKNVPEGKLASAHTKELLENRYVYIEYDEEPTDRYGRALVYIYLDEETMVNAKLLEDGYARVLTIPPNDKYRDYFEQLEKEAKENNAGLWSTGVFDD